jgi:copper homeostasis protein (lipoprotein)
MLDRTENLMSKRLVIALMACLAWGAASVGSTEAVAAQSQHPGLTTGMFRYMADAAMITLCGEGRTLPVAMEADYKALETAYLQAREEGGLEPEQALLVELEGSVATRQNAEESLPPRPTLVVDHFVTIRPKETCLVAMADSSLRNTYWKLMRLGGTPVAVVERQREPHLIFAAGEPRVSGSGGCNRVTGTYMLDGDELRLEKMASTRMACASGMELEDRFLQSLETVARYRINGRRLELLNATGARVAEFEAVELR